MDERTHPRLTQLIAIALEHASRTRDAGQIAYEIATDYASVARCFCVGTNAMAGRREEVIVVDVGAGTDGQRLTEVAAHLNGEFGIERPVLISACPDGVEIDAAYQRMSPGEFLRRNVPWSSAWALPTGSTVPGELDPNLFDKNFRQRSGVITSFDGVRKEGNAAALVQDWLSMDVESVLLLSGMRGSGKTWQLVALCADGWRRVLAGDPRVSSVMVFVSLGLPNVGRIVREGCPSTHAGVALLCAQYGTADLPWGGAILASLIDTGAVVLAIDGLDEVLRHPRPADLNTVVDTLHAELATGSRMILSGRTAFMRAFQRRSLRRGRGRAQRRVGWITLAPLEVTEADVAVSSLVPSTEVEDLLPTALGHPALRAELRRICKGGVVTASDIRRAILGVFVEFNLRHERSAERLLEDVDGETLTLDFSELDRRNFLAELAWYLAEREEGALSSAKPPRRLARQFNLDRPVVALDISTQLSLEPQVNAASQDASVGFVLPLAGAEGRRVLVGDTLSGAVFIAEALSQRLEESLQGSDGLDYFLRFLGRIRLQTAAAAFVKDALQRVAHERMCDVEGALRTAAIGLLHRAARRRCGYVFLHCYRFLVENLYRLKIISQGEAKKIEPWTDSARAIVRETGMVLVPAPASLPKTLIAEGTVLRRTAASLRRAAKSGAGERSRYASMFLIGQAETTNAEFVTFVQSTHGVEWRVPDVTKAASGPRGPNSMFAALTNEYHLYYWEESGHSGEFAPAYGSERFPVSYVSWWAAAAYCNWLSDGQGRAREYDLLRAEARKRENETPGYRLPSLQEWFAAAYVGTPFGGPPPRYPWEWPIQGLNPDRMPMSAARRSVAAKEALLEAGRYLGPVLEDDILDSGASGMVGNVKEWVDDVEGLAASPTSRDEQARHVIAGATSYLSARSFEYGYYTSLFAQNTNPDVGFRVARSLSDAEVETLGRREDEVTRGLKDLGGEAGS